MTCNSGITLASSGLTPTVNMLGYAQSADFTVSPYNANRVLTSGVVFNANSLILNAGTYIVSYKITLGTIVAGTSTISYLSYGLSTTSSTQVAPLQLYDGNLSLVFASNPNHTISSSEPRQITAMTTFRLNVPCNFTGKAINCISGGNFITATRIA